MIDTPMDQCSICENFFPDVDTGKKDSLHQGEFTRNLYCKDCEKSDKAKKMEEAARKRNRVLLEE